MRLKAIKISGFKSFPETVEFSLSGALIGLVGPNGCGKSNIVDAIRFALGETSAKALRAERLVDLIFAGNEKRRPLSFAEVTLTFEPLQDSDARNATVSAPPDSMQASAVRSRVPALTVGFSREFSITRRIYRDERGEYLINGREVRLKDLETQLRSMGLGKQAFYLFEQGKLDEIMRLTPKERRSIFEETAGTSRFLEQKREVKAKLAHTLPDFTRLLIQYETTRERLIRLEKEASAARLFLDKKKRLEALSAELLQVRYCKTMSQQAALHHSVERVNEKCALKEKQLQALDAARTELMSVLHVIEERIFSDKKLHLECENRVRVNLAELKELSAKLRSQNQATHHLKMEVQSHRDALEKIEKERLELKIKIAECENGRAQYEREAPQLLFVEELKGALAQAHQAHFKAQSELERSHQEICSQEHLIKMKEGVLHRLQDKLKHADNEWIAKSEMQQQQQLKKEQYAQKISELQPKSAALRTQILDLQSKRTELDSELQELRLQLRVRLEMQERAKVAKESTKGGAAELLRAAQDPSSPLYRKVRPFQWAKHMNHPYYQKTLLVEILDDVRLVVDYAVEHKLADVSIAVASLLSEQNRELVQSESMDRLLGSIPTLPLGIEAIASGEERLAEHALFFDAQRIFFLVNKRELPLWDDFEEQQEIDKELEEKCKVKQLQLELLDKQSAQLEKERSSLEERRRSFEMVHLESNFQLQELITQCAKRKKQESTDLKEIEELSGDIAPALERLECTKTAHIEKQKQLVRCAELLLVAEKRLKQEGGDIIASVERKRAAHQKLLVELARYQERFAALERQEATHCAEYNKKERHLAQCEMQEKELKEQQVEGERRCEKLGGEAQSTSLALRTREEERLVAQSALEKNQCEHIELRRTLAELSCDRERVGREEDHLSIQIAQFHTMAEKIGVALSTTMDATGIDSEKQVAAQVAVLEREVAQVDPLNFAALDQLEQEKARFDQLEGAFNDLKEAKAHCEKRLSELESEARTQFLATFEKARTSFQEQFKRLFGGGRADLILLGEDDLLTAGVEIIAQPPGQKMKAMTLLSGGERCLTALALLFALFEGKASPFCLMDEVDAPLDEANIERFTQVLAQFTPTTQFFMVTHNKKTMGIADLLIGVSMEERGVSKLLTLEFEKSTQLSGASEEALV